MKRHYFLVLSIVCGWLVGCEGKKSQNTIVEPSVTSVQVAVVTNVFWDKTLPVIGTLYPIDEATIAAQVEGTVEETLVDFGDRVKYGEDLATIDRAVYEAQLEQAMGNLARAEATEENARKNFDRIQRLQKSGAVSISELDASKAQRDQTEAEVKAAQGSEKVARLNVERSHVQAPFSGAIAQRFVERGDFVKVGAPLFRVVNDATLKFVFQVPERYASLIKKGLAVNLGVDNYPNKIFQGQIYLINPAIVTTSRSFDVAAAVLNEGLSLKANTFARGVMILERAVKTTVVPLEAIVNFAGVTKVFVAEGNEARSRQVKIGQIRNGLQEVEGIEEGEKVIVTGQNSLIDHALITVQNRSSSYLEEEKNL
ncbi:MAG: efflux RND transporter periplasmic adaptor subunit [Verrucomicrobiae bacterium]|nr:efflux RND transporter periplasmic adaptor subunit [Verrucomicrobiae bacterium]